MVKKHIKRIAVPKSWDITRKTNKFITRPNAGTHSFRLGIPLSVVFRDLLKRAKTLKETKKILQNNEILVDGKRRKDQKFIVGIMDTITIPKTDENFRVVVNTKGKLTLIKTDEKDAKHKICKIMKKTRIKGGKTQLNLSGGRNIIIDKDNYKAGDSLLIGLPGMKIKDHIIFEKNAMVFLTGGKMVGHVEKVEEVKGNNIIFKSKSKETVMTLKKYALTIGREKSLVSVKEE